jgi:NitT/TauT family transport system substrate-binding protein
LGKDARGSFGEHCLGKCEWNRNPMIRRCLMFGAMLLALASGSAVAQTGKWRYGVIEPKADSGFFLMADHRGFYKKFGLDVSILRIKNDQIGLKALLSGDLDSYYGGPASAIVAASRGADVRIVGCPWLVLPNGIFVHDTISSMAQLAGKTMAISAPGSLPDIIAHGALAKFHVPADKVKFASVGGDLDRYKALVAHVVDAAVVSEEYVPIAANEHIKLLVSGAEALPLFVRSCIQMTTKVINDRPQDAAKFMAAQMASLQYAVANKDEEIKVTQEASGIKPSDPRPAYIYDLAMREKAIGTDLPIPMDKVKWLQDELKSLGKLKQETDPDKLVDSQPRQAALQLLNKSTK